jgi:hypothetical protein
LGQTFDSGDLCSFGLHGKHGARFHRLPIDEYGASSTEGSFTSDMRAGQAQHVTKVMDQQQAWFDLGLVRDTIHFDTDSCLHELPHFGKFVGWERMLWRSFYVSSGLLSIGNQNLGIGIWNLEF